MAGRALSLSFQDNGNSASGDVRNVVVENLVIAGWTGRDQAMIEKHIAELETLGISRPASTPIFYRVSAARLSTASAIEALGERSSGEVEFFVLQSGGELWIGTGSDHTDREVEVYGVTVSKQMCDKPIASQVWRCKDVIKHWDQLILRSTIQEGGETVLYQEGPVSNILPPADLISRFSENGLLPEGTLMFCGTLPARGGIRTSGRFDFELEDPVLGRKIKHGYQIHALPIAG